MPFQNSTHRTKSSTSFRFFPNAAQNKTAEASYNSFIQTGSAKLVPQSLPQQHVAQYSLPTSNVEYKTASPQSFLVEASYNRFLQTGTATLAPVSVTQRAARNAYDSLYVKQDLQLPHTSPPQLQHESKISKLMHDLVSSSSLESLKTATVKLGVNKLCEEVEGFDKYLKPKITATKLVVNTYSRIEDALKQQVKPLEAITCGTLGASTTLITSMGGNALVMSAATGTIVGSSAAGPVGTTFGLLTASVIADTGLNAVAQVSAVIGDATQAACHATFEWGRNLSKPQPPTTSSMPNVPNLPVLRKF